MSARKVVIGSAILAGAQILARTFDLIAMIVIARLLTPEDFGLVALASSVMLVINAASELPVTESLVQRPDVKSEDFDTCFTLGLIRGCAVSIVLIALAAPFASIFDDGRLSAVLYVLALSPFATGLSSPRMISFQRKLNYSPLAISQLVGKFIALTGALLVAWISGSYWALIAGLVLGPIMTASLSFVFAPYKPRLGLAGSYSFLTFAGWMTIARIVWTINMQADRFFIGSLLGKEVLGYYSLGSELASTATYSLAQPATQPLFSGFARIGDDLERLQEAYMRGQQVLMACVMPVGVGLAIVASPLVELLLGEKWMSVVPVVTWLAPVVALQMLTVAVQAVSMATGQTRILALREVVNLLVRLPITVLAAWWFGLLGAVVARSFSGIAVIWFNLFLASKLLSLPIFRQITNCWRSMVSVLVMASSTLLFAYALPEPQTLLMKMGFLASQISLGIAVYGASHLAIWQFQGRPDGVERLLLNFLKFGDAPA